MIADEKDGRRSEIQLTHQMQRRLCIEWLLRGRGSNNVNGGALRTYKMCENVHNTYARVDS